MRVLNNEATPGGASAKGLLNKMNCQDFLSVFYMLKFILPHLTVLSKTFQKGEINVSWIAPNIEKTKFKINQVTQQSEPLKQLKKDAANCFSACEITINKEKITRQYSNSIIKNLEEQFPKEVLNDLDAFSVLNVEQFPTNIHSLEFAMKLSC